MIKILILSDDVFGWCDRITDELSDTKSITDLKEKSARVWNDRFTFQILAKIEPCCGERFNNIILDKYINDNTYNSYIEPCLMSPVTQTTNYWNGYNENNK